MNKNENMEWLQLVLCIPVFSPIFIIFWVVPAQSPTSSVVSEDCKTPEIFCGPLHLTFNQHGGENRMTEITFLGELLF